MISSRSVRVRTNQLGLWSSWRHKLIISSQCTIPLTHCLFYQCTIPLAYHLHFQCTRQVAAGPRYAMILISGGRQPSLGRCSGWRSIWLFIPSGLQGQCGHQQGVNFASPPPSTQSWKTWLWIATSRLPIQNYSSKQGLGCERLSCLGGGEDCRTPGKGSKSPTSGQEFTETSEMVGLFYSGGENGQWQPLPTEDYSYVNYRDMWKQCITFTWITCVTLSFSVFATPLMCTIGSST